MKEQGKDLLASKLNVISRLTQVIKLTLLSVAFLVTLGSLSSGGDRAVFSIEYGQSKGGRETYRMRNSTKESIECEVTNSDLTYYKIFVIKAKRISKSYYIPDGSWWFTCRKV